MLKLKTNVTLETSSIRRNTERICSVLQVVSDLKELLGTTFNQAIQHALHQLQVLHLCLEHLSVLPQEVGDVTFSSGQM